MKKKILLALFAIFVVLQFFQISKIPLPFHPNDDIKAVLNPPGEIYALLKSACYDCHSNHTNYPGYANFQPLGWWLQGHVRGARMNLNFSEFAQIPVAERQKVLEESAEEIEHGEMPLKSYVWLHGEAKLTAEQKQKLVEWLKNPIPADLGFKN